MMYKGRFDFIEKVFIGGKDSKKYENAEYFLRFTRADTIFNANRPYA